VDLGLEVGDLLPHGRELHCYLVRLLGGLAQLLGHLVSLSPACTEAHLAALDRPPDHGPGGLDELPAHGHQAHPAHQAAGLLEGVDDHGVPEHVPECRPVLRVEVDEINGEPFGLLLGQEGLAPGLSVQHLVQGQKGRAAEVAPLQEGDGRGGHLVIVDHDGLHAPPRRHVQGDLVLGIDVGKLRDGPVDALHLPAVPGLEHRPHRPGVPLGHVRRGLLLRPQVIVLPGKVPHRLLQLVGHPGQLGFPVLHGVELLLQRSQGAAGVLALLAQLLDPPIQVLDLELRGLLLLSQRLQLGPQVLGQPFQPFLLKDLGVQGIGPLPDPLVPLLDRPLQRG